MVPATFFVPDTDTLTMFEIALVPSIEQEPLKNPGLGVELKICGHGCCCPVTNSIEGSSGVQLRAYTKICIAFVLVKVWL
jgi:hypothetical protein